MATWAQFLTALGAKTDAYAIVWREENGMYLGTFGDYTFLVWPGKAKVVHNGRVIYRKSGDMSVIRAKIGVSITGWNDAADLDALYVLLTT